jgi:DNA (cytosine-5)-methyltransferase 1
MLVHASLFSGIGGFDLAAEWMGWDNLFHCEWNPFGQRVLKHHFPNSISYNDITKTDFSIHNGSVDILTGGFPCQPYSSAGKRLGKEDERHLWPHMLRTIQEVKPRWVVGENVRGLTNWNGGLVFNEVQVELENEGYEVQPYLLPAAGVNATHRRDRIWFIAYNDTYSNSRGLERTKEKGWNGEYVKWESQSGIIANPNNEMRYGQRSNNSEWQNKEQQSYNWNELRNNIGSTGEEQNVTNSEHFRLEHGEKRGSINKGERTTQRKRGEFAKQFKADGWSRFPTKPPICGGNDGIPRELDSITFPKWRNESIKAYGNAIVPQVAHQIFKAIEEFELMVNK